MNGKLKKQALKALFSNRMTAVRIFLTYAFEIALLLLSDYFFLDNIIWKLIFFCLLFILSSGEYNVFMKLAEGKEVSGDDFYLIFSDKEYISHFKSEGKSRYYTIVQAAVFLILCRILILLY
ncbi:MAG: hypothetical protein LUD77_02730 [Clostridiales bacterium]|nr:hypothetical protein [Clostridiales bacterium]